MALSQVTVWVPGQVLTAAAQNAEFQNILTNPISLISPTTGTINFNLQAHTNLVPAAVTGTSGAAGNTLQTTGGAAFWGSIGSAFTSLTSGQLLVGASSGGFTTLAIGTTGQVLAVTSSNSIPAWQVIPPGGGLSTGAVSTGALYYLSTAGALVPLTIGTSGQVLTVSTALLPSWAAAAAGGGGVPTVVSVRTSTPFTLASTAVTDVTGSTMVFSLSNSLRRVLLQGGPTYLNQNSTANDATFTAQIATSSGVLPGSDLTIFGALLSSGEGGVISWSYAFSPATTLSRTYVIQAFNNANFSTMTFTTLRWTGMEVSSS